MARGNRHRTAEGVRPKRVLTTGEVAKLCNVAPRTVSKWFDSGQLRGYRIPGSRDRRIPLEQLIRFMKAHGMPVEGLRAGPMRVLLLDADRELTKSLAAALSKQDYEVRTAGDGFEAGLLVGRFTPDVFVVDVTAGLVNERTVICQVRSEPDLKDMQVVATGTNLSQGRQHALREAGFDACLAKPFKIEQLMEVLAPSGD